MTCCKRPTDLDSRTNNVAELTNKALKGQMTSPGRSTGRSRLRDRLRDLDCLDLARHSSSLLSPSLYAGLGAQGHDFSENDFPFQVSPPESFTRPAQGRGKARQSQDQPGAEAARPTSPAHTPLAAVTNTVLPPDVHPHQSSPAAHLWHTPAAKPSQAVAPDLSRNEVSPLSAAGLIYLTICIS